MSEFSESYHLLADRDAAVALLERSGLSGWVLGTAPAGWTTLVVDRDFTGAPDDALVTANDGLLLHYVNAEDHGWSLQAWHGTAPVCRYEAAWDDEIEADVSGLSVDALRDAVGERDGIDWDDVVALLVEDIDEADLIRPGANPGHRSAAALGLGVGAGGVDWLSGAYLRADGGDRPGATDVIRVGGDAPDADAGSAAVADLVGQVTLIDEIPGVPLPTTARWTTATVFGATSLHVGVAAFDHSDLDLARAELEATLADAGFTTERPVTATALDALGMAEETLAELGWLEGVGFAGPAGVGLARLRPVEGVVAAQIQFTPGA